MAKLDPGAEKLRAEFDASWQAAIEQPETLDVVSGYSAAAPVRLEALLSRLEQVAKACAAQGLITPAEGERAAASADDIRQIMDGVDAEQLASIARQLR
jgi:hypothetical protein